MIYGVIKLRLILPVIGKARKLIVANLESNLLAEPITEFCSCVKILVRASQPAKPTGTVINPPKVIIHLMLFLFIKK